MEEVGPGRTATPSSSAHRFRKRLIADMHVLTDCRDRPAANSSADRRSRSRLVSAWGPVSLRVQ